MTREHEITIASCAYGRRGSSIDFEAGAKWADANPKSPWISVDDDLPCDHNDMIALVDNFSKDTYSVLVRFNHGGINFAYMYCNGYKQDWHWSERGIITHWMQIPKLEEE